MSMENKLDILTSKLNIIEESMKEPSVVMNVNEYNKKLENAKVQGRGEIIAIMNDIMDNNGANLELESIENEEAKKFIKKAMDAFSKKEEEDNDDSSDS